MSFLDDVKPYVPPQPPADPPHLRLHQQLLPQFVAEFGRLDEGFKLAGVPFWDRPPAGVHRLFITPADAHLLGNGWWLASTSERDNLYAPSHYWWLCENGTFLASEKGRDRFRLSPPEVRSATDAAVAIMFNGRHLCLWEGVPTICSPGNEVIDTTFTGTSVAIAEFINHAALRSPQVCVREASGLWEDSL